MHRVLVLLLVAVGAVDGLLQGGLAPGPVIALPGVKGRIDHLAVDVAGGRLFVAALGNDSVEVVDTRAGAWLRRLDGFHEPQGIAFVPSPGLVAVANGGSGDLVLLDATDYHVVARVALGSDADNVRYDASAKQLFVGYGSGAIARVALDGKRMGEVKLAGHPESFQLEPSGSRIFVNVPDARQVAVLDRTSMSMIGTWPVSDAAANYPMALDATHHRLYLGCRRPAVVLIYDTNTGKRVGSLDTVGDTDDLFYDTERQRVYVTGGDGSVDVLHQDDPDHLTRMSRLPSASGARTSLYVQEQGRIYVAVPARGTQQSAVRGYDVRN